MFILRWGPVLSMGNVVSIYEHLDFVTWGMANRVLQYTDYLSRYGDSHYWSLKRIHKPVKHLYKPQLLRKMTHDQNISPE